MEEEKGTPHEIETGRYDPPDRPFDAVEPDAETALVCETDVAVRDRLASVLKNMGYQTTQAESAREALKSMRFYLFDMVVLDEHFDCSASGRNEVLAYLQTLNMAIRRQMFVALVSDTYRTMDNMAAFNLSANVIINLKHIDKAPSILKVALADNAGFYRVMKDTLKRLGKT
jgi:CheY-like chemotaxis protein